MKLIYISGPLRSNSGNDWERELNIRRAELAEIECMRRGWVAYCPHKNTKHLEGLFTFERLMEMDKEIISRCDAMCMVEGWRLSEGANMERTKAFKIGIPVYPSAWEVPRPNAGEVPNESKKEV